MAFKDACDNGVRIAILKAIYFGLCERGTALARFLSQLRCSVNIYIFTCPETCVGDLFLLLLISLGIVQNRPGEHGFFFRDGEVSLVCHRRGEIGVFQRAPAAGPRASDISHLGARWGELWPGAVGPTGQGTERAGGCSGTICTRAGSAAANPLQGSPRGHVVAPRSQPCQ